MPIVRGDLRYRRAGFVNEDVDTLIGAIGKIVDPVVNETDVEGIQGAGRGIVHALGNRNRFE
jgi:hypothetical protein